MNKERLDEYQKKLKNSNMINKHTIVSIAKELLAEVKQLQEAMNKFCSCSQEHCEWDHSRDEEEYCGLKECSLKVAVSKS